MRIKVILIVNSDRHRPKHALFYYFEREKNKKKKKKEKEKKSKIRYKYFFVSPFHQSYYRSIFVVRITYMNRHRCFM
jgi:hypothetical protein